MDEKYLPLVLGQKKKFLFQLLLFSMVGAPHD